MSPSGTAALHLGRRPDPLNLDRHIAAPHAGFELGGKGGPSGRQNGENCDDEEAQHGEIISCACGSIVKRNTLDGKPNGIPQ